MSPRSEEFLASAKRRLRSAHAELEFDAPEVALGVAYYAMLYAARAALSEADRHAKTHSGTWNLFRQTFVVSGQFDKQLAAAAQALQQPREAADYDAAAVSEEFAVETLRTAERFVAAVEELIVA